jgi:hypothetical protein
MFLHENINGQTANAQKCTISLVLLLHYQEVHVVKHKEPKRGK